MAVASEARMRLFEFKDIAGGFLDDLPLSIRAMQPKLINIHVVGKPADIKAYAEIDAPDSVMAVSTAVAIEHLSSNAEDKNAAAGAVQTFNTIGINSTNEYVNRTETQNAADGTTVVTTTNTYKECLHAYANAHGTADMDATGNITIRTIADTTIITIPATDNESNGARLLVPDNHVIMLYGGQLKRLAATVDEGVLIRMVYVNPVDGETGMAAADRAVNWLEFMAGPYTPVVDIPKGHVFESGTWITLEHSSLVDAGEDYDLDLNFLVYKK